MNRQLFAILTAAACAAWTLPSLFAGEADIILRKSGVQGGLAVVVGCEDPALVAGLHARGRFIVQALDSNPARIHAAREHLQEEGIYGPASAGLLRRAALPYADETVNLLVDPAGEIPKSEVMRALAPRGVALLKGTRIEKPVPDDTDEWTHFLHDASGNAVANDARVGSPTQLRWVAGPRWCRTHEFGSSVNSVVSAGGRIFTIFDEGITGVYRKMPQDCNLIARDAASGVLLWKIAMPDWQPEFGTSTGNRWQVHHTVARRLIAEGDRVYATLKFLNSPVSMIDAATGEVLTESLAGTACTDEMILFDGVLVVKTIKELSPQAGMPISKTKADQSLVALDPARNRELWRKDNIRVLSYSIAAQDGKLIYHDAEEFVCLDTRTGRELWRTPLRIPLQSQDGQSVILISNGVLVYNGMIETPVGKNVPAAAGGKKTGTKNRKKISGSGGMFGCLAFSMADGKQLWQGPGSKGAGGACPQSDLFVIKGTVWPGSSLVGYDLRTGEPVKKLNLHKLVSPGHHPRCMRSKATEKYLIRPKRGAEFIDLEGDHHMRNDWLRAPCFSGATPANGLFYKPPDQCFCYPGVKVLGYMALASGKCVAHATGTKVDRLMKGPAYKVLARQADSGNAEADWPMHRRDIRRSGSTRMSVGYDLTVKWSRTLQSPGTQPVVAGKRLWIAEKDRHRLRCLDTDTGNELWSHTVGGRMDSAPTINRGRVIFGCRDGAVYCLNAEDGKLVWRFLAAPEDRRIVSHEQLESVWPIHGSVLVQDGVVYYCAGRSSYLDGGMLVQGLDAVTGELRFSHHLEGPWPDIRTDTGTPFAMEGALPDLIVGDGDDLYMGRIKFDAELNRLEVKEGSPLGELDMGKIHLAATGGFLDSSGYDRIYWMNSRYWPGFYFSNHAPKSGQLLVFNNDTTYATKYFYERHMWSPLFVPGEKGYPLFADRNANEPVFWTKDAPKEAREWIPGAQPGGRQGGIGAEKGTGYVRNAPPEWLKMIPVRTRAMVLAGDKLLLAGTPDVVDDKDPSAALEGRKGALLHVYRAGNGELLKDIKLHAEPVFDGMIAADGKVFVSSKDGSLGCYE
jgi:outer membrane protein assembly factor BamB